MAFPGFTSTQTDTQDTQKYTVVEFKICEMCRGRFLRTPQPKKKLATGTVIDANKYCPSCESKVVKTAKEAARPVMRYDDPKYTPPTIGELDRMERECVRKEAFSSPEMAQRVASRMRRRHRGANPVDVYRCRTKVDPVLFPDLAGPHWHLGGKPDRKL